MLLAIWPAHWYFNFESCRWSWFFYFEAKILHINTIFTLQEQLGEGLGMEAEKALCALLCFSTDKFIRIKFIEGCLDNLANHRWAQLRPNYANELSYLRCSSVWCFSFLYRSVPVSIRLLPKLFSSFQQLRGMDMHQVIIKSFFILSGVEIGTILLSCTENLFYSICMLY